MVETLFALDKGNYHDCQKLYRGDRKQDYYTGDYWLDDTRPVKVRADKREIGPYTVINMRADTPQFFRRTQKHIREDATDLSVLWFVRRGKMHLSTQQGRQEAGPGDFLLTRSMSPFFVELLPGDDGVHEVLHMTVPTHVLRCHISSAHQISAFVPVGSAETEIAQSMLTQVFDAGSKLAQDTSRLLIESALQTIGHALRDCPEAASARQTVSERRLEEALRFIEVHLSDPNLCTAMVSEGCGVSQRYLSLLLQGTGKTFSDLVWSRRLEMAREWLEKSNPRDIAISEIAYGVGFKSTAHFSRKFKRVFGQNPRDFRMAALGEREGELEEFPEPTVGTLQ